MTPRSGQSGEVAAPPASLVEQVTDALEHLYDLDHLQHHPLAHDPQYRASPTVENSGQRLRSELVHAVEAMSPGPTVSFQAPQARTHNLLVLHYVECRTVQEAAHMTDISRRQAHRDLRQGAERIAAILWSRRCGPTQDGPRVRDLSSLESEVGRLEHHPSPTDMCALLGQASETVKRLAEQRDVHLNIVVPAHPVVVQADPSLAEQVLVSLLSHAVQQSQAGSLHVALTAEEAEASMVIRYSRDPGTLNAPPVSVAIAEVADQLGWKVMRRQHADDSRVVTLHMAKYGPCALVIDDNEGLVRLVGCYLTDQACRVISATDGQEGLRLAQEHKPDVVILDVMVPHIHGWEVLQRLRNHPQTADTPVIICSVVNDPELAYSLGASLFLPKPVSRSKILEALHQLKIL